MAVQARSCFAAGAEFSTTSAFIAQPDTFVLQQPPFALQSAAIAGQRTVGADEAMAGNDDAHGVRAVGKPDRAHGERTLQPAGHARVAECRPHRNPAQGPPYVALK